MLAILPWVCTLLQSPPDSEQPFFLGLFPQSGLRLQPIDSSHEVFAPTTFSRTQQRSCWRGLPHHTTCTLRFSQPLGALIRHVPAGLISCQIRSWGFALQSFSPLVQPSVVSDAATLMPLNKPGVTTLTASRPPKRLEYNEFANYSALPKQVTAFDSRQLPPSPCRNRLSKQTEQGLSLRRRNGSASNPTFPQHCRSAETSRF